MLHRSKHPLPFLSSASLAARATARSPRLDPLSSRSLLTQSGTKCCSVCFSSVSRTPLISPSALPLPIQAPISSLQAAARAPHLFRGPSVLFPQIVPLTAARRILGKQLGQHHLLGEKASVVSPTLKGKFQDVRPFMT